MNLPGWASLRNTLVLAVVVVLVLLLHQGLTQCTVVMKKGRSLR